MHTILVCYEERPMASRVLERAAELARAFDARIIVTSVAPVMGFMARGSGPYDPTDPPARHEHELEDAVARFRELGIDRVESVVGYGPPAQAIVNAADELEVDMIVLGAHDGGLLTRLFGGSVTDEVAHKAHADVFVVR